MKNKWIFYLMEMSRVKMRKSSRVAFLLLLAGMLNVAAGTMALSQHFTVTMRDATIKEVLSAIESQSDVSFFYQDEAAVTKTRVSVDFKNAALKDILEQVFEGTSLTYKLTDKYVAIIDKAVADDQQQALRTVNGQVKGADGSPIPGVSVLVKGTALGTITDADGNFTLTGIPKDAVLQFSFIGMKSIEVSSTGQDTFDIVLQDEILGLGEVVVTALGMKKSEKALGYSVQKVEGDVLQVAPEANVLSNLTGKVAGLTIYNSTEFYRTPSISLRGESPLVVIDGVPVSTNFWNISPNDVQEMSVLKGATASALYGSKGAGGAIMITTKKGDGQKVSVTINSSTMFKAGYAVLPKPQTVYGTGDNGRYSYFDGAGGGVNDAGSYVYGPRLDERDAATASGWKELSQWDSPIHPDTGERIPTPWRSRGKDNLKNYLETGFITTNNISVTQSTDKGSFRVSMSHAYQKGQVPNTKLNNSTLNLGGTVKLLDKLSLESSFSYNKQFSPNLPSAGYSGSGYVYNLMVWSGVDYDIRDFRDYWLVEDVQQKFYQYTPWYNNPYFLAYENERGYYRDGGYGFASLNYTITDDLKLMGRTGINTNTTRENTKTPISMGQGLGNYSENTSYDFSVNADVLLTYDKKISDDLELNFLAGGTLNFNEYRSLSASTDGLNVPGFFSLSNSTNPVSASNYLSKKQVNSVFGKLSLGYMNGLYLDVTGRNDWSSSLPKETRSYFYPSVAFSGIVSEFIDMPDKVSLLKVRASWTLSKKDIGLYSLRPVYSISADAWDGQSTASYPGAIRGADVKPQETRTYELGTDLRFFNNRLNVDFSYYNTLRYNMVTNAPISDASGFTSKTINTDEEYEKKGFEVVLGGQPVKNDVLTWDTQFNWSTYRWYWSKVDPVFSPNTDWVHPGGRMDYYVNWDWARDPEGNVIHGSNGMPVWDSEQSVLGYTGEDFVWGWSNDVKYRDFNFAFSFDGRVGGILHSQTNQAMWNSGAHPESVNQYREAAVNGINSYVGDGVVVVSGEVIRDEQGNITSDTREFAPNQTKVNYITYMKTANPYIGSPTSQNLFDKTFVKLRELSLTYNLPTKIISRVGLSEANIGVVGRNLWLWTKEVDHVDPDSGSDNLSSASYRNIGFNLKLSF
ncbi:TonB-linked outer membrane protein, SusC/RagA family [Saccharicrinis carchari]|uniref:TonB-linked outer membrane protein, SusC/RagA family n=1 Tax=Saccharicrinis carchari TaxID=1168039 RepID=A0A521C126_SACCC|nr:SusC/RagA family TonB-linked outer membrane protein [Saccharicrinis carchari]SMO52410.1 TonB-linked outer membrane protein, SusC/RagA family [Saccharicrinis carchari]